MYTTPFCQLITLQLKASLWQSSSCLALPRTPGGSIWGRWMMMSSPSATCKAKGPFRMSSGWKCATNRRVLNLMHALLLKLCRHSGVDLFHFAMLPFCIYRDPWHAACHAVIVPTCKRCNQYHCCQCVHILTIKCTVSHTLIHPNNT